MKRPFRPAGSLAFGFGLLFLAVSPIWAADANPAENAKPAEKIRPIQTLTLHLVDADHKPVEGAYVGTFVYSFDRLRKADQADANGFMYSHKCVSNKEGVAVFPAKRKELADWRNHVQIIARQAARGLIAFAELDGAHYQPVVELTLVPECRIKGKLECPELANLGRKINWTNVYLNQGRSRMMSCDSNRGEFQFFVPPGTYNLDGYGTYAGTKKAEVTIPSGKRQIELTLTLPAKKFALLMGHPAPELREIAAWKNSTPLKLADLKGKCVILDFWGYWCGPCVYGMPETFKLYDQYGKLGLVVIGVHVDVTKAKIESVAALDAKLVDTRKKLWKGRDLPFPVAITRHSANHGAIVVEDYGIQGFPTMLLIDRRGNIVDIMYHGPEGIALLQKALDEIPAGPASATKPASTVVKAAPGKSR